MHMQYELVVHIHVRWLDLLSRRVLASSLVSVGRDPHVSTTIKNLNQSSCKIFPRLAHRCTDGDLRSRLSSQHDTIQSKDKQ